MMSMCGSNIEPPLNSLVPDDRCRRGAFGGYIHINHDLHALSTLYPPKAALLSYTQDEGIVGRVSF